jgi:Rrf2 family protein
MVAGVKWGACDNRAVRVSAKVDYAVRALVELAAADAGRPLKGDQIARVQGIPVNFLENILAELRRARLVGSQRGAEGGYWLATPADGITVADVIRAVDGPLADVHGTAPEELEYPGAAGALRDVWVATRANLRAVLENVTIADIVADTLPAKLRKLLAGPDAWARR